MSRKKQFVSSIIFLITSAKVCYSTSIKITLVQMKKNIFLLLIITLFLTFQVEAIEVGIEMGGGPATVSSRFALKVLEYYGQKDS